MRLFFVPLIAAALVVVPGPSATAASVRVTSLSALQSALDKANPGDTITLADGSYAASSTLSIKRSGTASAPVTVAAEHTGQATITGSKTFAFGSGVSNVVLRGFKFRNGAALSVPAGASNNRLTRNDFQLTTGGNWVTVSGDDTVVDRNVFQNRTTQGVFLQILGPSGAMAKHVHVHHNYFYNHQFTGSNGGESIRLGLSDRQSYSANALIENNLFEKANGDIEAISVKSSDNVVRYNTIRDSKGYIVLRHGNRSLVEGNLLFGSGIRFHGNDHKVVGNYVANSGGRAIVFGSGDEADSGPTSKLHDRPDRVTVAYNTVLGSNSVIDGDGGDFKPKDCVVADNIVKGTSGTLVTLPSGSTVKYEGNITFGGTAGIPSRSVDPKLVKDAAGLYRLAAGSPAIDAGVGSYPFAAKDFDLQTRSGTYDVGADEYFASGTTRVPLTKADVGPTAP
ncbi:polysaccharide lyase 6 family protein [Amycolatopsis sp. SID8362]|uniref:polysaccharide lyase 6 family protein n=1 Tax=Amycolatopsis sp. SID8362 TaxID=2690346 RepID=UPI001370FE40|nr:polysaccharide lyase 6 family protein [Amycolatopsis sp. SID8362]NBH05088.1 lyase [Amycolatopsis sp. SID8362]NED41788.1 lyase [Amycolatopsis sp. SID8362]